MRRKPLHHVRFVTRGLRQSRWCRESDNDNWEEMGREAKEAERELKKLESTFKEQWHSIINEEMKAVDDENEVVILQEPRQAKDTVATATLNRKPAKNQRPLLYSYLSKHYQQMERKHALHYDRIESVVKDLQATVASLKVEKHAEDDSDHSNRTEQKRLLVEMQDQAKKVEGEYRSELTELKTKYESSKEDIVKIFKNASAKWKGNDEALRELLQVQTQLLKEDYKKDLARLTRTHDLSVAEVRQAADKSNSILQAVISRQGKRSVWAGITIGLLLLALSFSLAANYFQFVFIRMNGTQFILSRVLKYLYNRQALDRENPDEQRHRKHMEIMMGTS